MKLPFPKLCSIKYLRHNSIIIHKINPKNANKYRDFSSLFKSGKNKAIHYICEKLMVNVNMNTKKQTIT